MHPILASWRRLLIYLGAWTPIFALLVLSAWLSGAPLRVAAAAIGPACLVYAFVCLSPLHICRSRPLHRSNALALAVTFGMASLVASLLFTGTAWAIALALEGTAAFHGVAQHVQPLVLYCFGVGPLLYLLSGGLHYAWLAVEASRESERRVAEAHTLAREAELQALRMQINPHFLFNSLHSISALATQDGARAREMCVRLAGFLRSSLSLGGLASIPLREELGLAKSYLEVEHVRFGERLRIEEEIEPGCDECAVPPLLLQPLVENAVKHGIAGLVEGGRIRLAAKRAGGLVSITLENAFDPEADAPGKLGMGLAHVGKRLQAHYGEDAGIEAGPSGGVYRVVLRFPCESPMASSRRA